MKKLFLAGLSALVLLMGVHRLAAQDAEDEDAAGNAEEVAVEAKPMIVVSVSGYDELRSDLEALGEMANNPELAEGLTNVLKMVTNEQEPLAGLDGQRPWGAVVMAGPNGFPAYAFLPVNDLDQLLKGLSAVIGEAEDVGNGVYRLEKENQSLFVRENKGWAMVAQMAEQLIDLPEDPAEFLDGLNKTYDVAVRVNIQNIPEFYRNLAVDQLKTGFDQAMQNVERLPNETDEQFEFRSNMMKAQMQMVAAYFDGLDEITVGWSIDAPGKRMFVDMSISAVEGSELAKQLVLEEPPASKLAGLLSPGSILSMHVNSAVRDQDVQQIEALIEPMRKQIMTEIDKDEDLADPQVRDAVKKLVNDLIDVAEATMKEGQMNGGLAVFGEGPMNLVAGAVVADGKDLEKIVKDVVELGKNEPDFPKVKMDVETYKDVTFHVVEIPMPEGEESEKVQEFFGQKPLLVTAFGEDTAFIAMGEDGIGAIKKVIDASADPADDLPPVKFTLALGPIFRIASQQHADANPLAMLAAGLEEGKDHLNITFTSEDNMLRYRFEAEEGVLRLIGQAASIFSTQAGAAVP